MASMPAQKKIAMQELQQARQCCVRVVAAACDLCWLVEPQAVQEKIQK